MNLKENDLERGLATDFVTIMINGRTWEMALRKNEAIPLTVSTNGEKNGIT